MCTEMIRKLIGKLDKTYRKLLVRLFKTYCCTFYGSQMWQVNCQCINRLCKSWNKFT